MLFRGMRLGLGVVGTRRYSTPGLTALKHLTIKRVAPEATVGVREAVLWPGRPDMCRLAEDAQGLHLAATLGDDQVCLLYTSPSPRDKRQSRMPSSA